MGPLAGKVAIRPERDVNQTKGATADAVKGWQTSIGGNGSAYARASADLTCAMSQSIAQRYCVTRGGLHLAVDTGAVHISANKMTRACKSLI